MYKMNNYKLIGLAGKKGAGKDTLAESLGDAMAQRFAFADELKETVHTLFDIPRELLWGTQEEKEYRTSVRHPIEMHKMNVREVLQVFGTDVCRMMDNRVWINSLMDTLWKEADPDKVQIITDVRFTNELDFIQEQGGIVVYLTRGVTGDSHVSENIITPSDCDFTIDNRTVTKEVQKMALLGIIENVWGLSASELEWGSLFGAGGDQL